MIRNKFFLGLFFLISCCGQFLLPANMVNLFWLVFFFSLFNLGIICISEAITRRLQNKSLSKIIFQSIHNLGLFLLIAVVGGVILEGVSQWLDKLWVYPFFSNEFYIFVFAIGFGMYWLTISESYLAVKATFDFILKRSSLKKPKHFTAIIRTLLGVGILFIVYALIEMIQSYNGKYVFELSRTLVHPISFGDIIIGFLGIWFILEYIEYKRKESSLLLDTLSGYLNPLLSVIFGSLILGLIMEIQNVHHLWLYTNWPWQAKLFGIYAEVLLIAWPLHYIFFLSLFRALSKKESKQIW